MDDNYSKIIPNLYIGNRNSTQLLYPSLNLVVNCTRDLPAIFPNTIRVPIDDSYDWNPVLLDIMINTNVLDTIHSNLLKGNKVLVHCMAGAQRSCAVVACYLIKYYGMYPEKAIEYIRKHRRIAFFGHITFEKAIESFYNYLINVNK